MTAHILHKCDAEDCKICPGNLALCAVCGGAEASMPTECPGRRMTSEEADSVQAGATDYANGRWRGEPIEPPIPMTMTRVQEMLDYATVYGAVDENTPNGPISDKAAGDPMDDVRRGAIWAYKRVLGLIGEDVPPPEQQRLAMFGTPIPPEISELLVILLEEHAEVIHRCAKALRFGLDEVQAGQPLTNAQRISEELGDRAAVEEILVKRGVLVSEDVIKAAEHKYDKLRRFLQHASV